MTFGMDTSFLLRLLTGQPKDLAEKALLRYQEAVGQGDSFSVSDSSGRFQIPSEWFDKVGQGKHVYIMADPKERCLRMASVRNMEARLAKIRERAIIDPAMNRALQVIGENAEQIEVDIEK